MIFASGLPAAVAAKAATSEIPVVFQIGANPIDFDLVASLSHPGGNVTGVTSLQGETNVKRLQLLHEAVPAIKVMAAVVNPTEPNSGNLTRSLEAAGRALGLELHVMPVATERDYDNVFAFVRDRRPAALVISPDAVLNSRPRERAALLLREEVPAITSASDFAMAGGLISYASNDMTRAAGVYVGRILKGEKPGNLPVQEATTYTLTINLKTAAALGITFPTGLLARADEVIE